MMVPCQSYAHPFKKSVTEEGSLLQMAFPWYLFSLELMKECQFFADIDWITSEEGTLGATDPLFASNRGGSPNKLQWPYQRLTNHQVDSGCVDIFRTKQVSLSERDNMKPTLID